jgi:hypothetical protein
MRLHEYSVFARFRYNDLKVGISSGNQALKRCAFVGTNPADEPITSGLPVIRTEWELRGNFLTQAIARAYPSQNYHVELLYQRRTRRARRVFQRLTPPTAVSIFNGICSG